MGGRKKLTTKEFIERSKKYHGDKYDYSLVEYFTDRTKVKIICPEHGEFQQTPNHHSRGVGCPKCVGMNKTTETIIKEFKKVHGDKYDYSLVSYINSKSKIKILCDKHGEFKQSPNTHLSGHGCPKCSAEKLSNIFSSNTLEFIKKSKKTHGDKYDYSLVEYKNAYTKIKIICLEHGEFEQEPSSHLSGRGCQKCGYNKNWAERKITTEKFIEKAKKIHGDKYDYSQVEYKNAIDKIKIICPEHGIFEQTPNSHLSNSGCMKCGGRYSDKEDFLDKVKKIHNNKYDYSQVEYTNAHKKIKIICPKHGLFEQTPQSHKKCGCPTCGQQSSTKSQTTSQENFIKKCKKVHGNKYDYSLVKYKGSRQKVKIICAEHGVFDQLAFHHSRGVGCPMCSNYYGNFNDKDLYIFYDEKFNLMKIGVSKDPTSRIKGISKGKDKNGLILLKTYKKSAALENLLHKEYSTFRTEHTLYKEGFTEWFNLPKTEIYNINNFIRFCKLDSLYHKTTISS